MNKQRIINAALDCLSQFKASKYPLKNAASDIIAARKLNSQERKCLLDIVFTWSRQSYLVNDFLKHDQRFFISMSNKEKDNLAINLLAQELFDFSLSGEIVAFNQRYQEYLSTLGNARYIISLGDVIASHLRARFGEDAEVVTQGLLAPPKKYCAFDGKKLKRELVISTFAGLGIEATPHPVAPYALAIDGDLNPAQLPAHVRNDIWLMDAGSQIIAELIRPQKDQSVLDMCCGEGGKARYITMNECNYWAMDIDEARLNRAKKRLAGKNVQFICADATTAPWPDESFDWILVDAPCSGVGILRRNPDLIYRLNDEMLKHYQRLQSSLLASATRLCKPGGTIVYATCSLFPVENMQQIDALLKSNKKLIAHTQNLILDAQLHLSTDVLNKQCLELIPHIHDCDGFFAAGIMKARE